VVTTTAIRITAVVALVAIAGITAGGWYVRREQFAQLVTAAEAVDEVLDQWHADRAAILADLPSAHYRTQEVEQRAAERLQRITASTITSLDDATVGVRRVRVALPWNAAVDVARDTYLHHVDRWSGYLERIVEEPVAGLDEPPPLTASRDAAAVALDAAMPPFAGDELRQRISALLSH
jgi:hypothetical protein